MLYIVSRKRNGWAKNNISTLYLIITPYCLQKLLKLVVACWRYSKPKQCRFWDTVKDSISKVHAHVSPGSAETLVRRGEKTNHHLIAYSLSNIAKHYQNRLMCVEVRVCDVGVFFSETQFIVIMHSFVSIAVCSLLLQHCVIVLYVCYCRRYSF